MYQSSIKSARRVHSAQKLPPLSSKRVHFSSQVAKSRKTTHCSSYQTTVSQLYIVNACQFKKSVSKHNLSESVCKRRGGIPHLPLLIAHGPMAINGQIWPKWPFNACLIQLNYCILDYFKLTRSAKKLTQFAKKLTQSAKKLTRSAKKFT